MSNVTPVRPEAPTGAALPGACTPAARRRQTVMSAAAATVSMWVIAVHVGGVDLAVRTGGGVLQIGPISVVVSSVVASVVALAALGFLQRRTRKARTIWTALIVAGLLVSLLGPLGAVSMEAMNVLMTMHAAVAAIVLIAGRRMARPVPPEQV